MDARDQGRHGLAGTEELRIDDEGDPRGYGERCSFVCLEQELDRRGREAEVTKASVAQDGRHMVLAVLGIGASAARRRHEALGDKVADMAPGGAGPRGEVMDIHRQPFDKACVTTGAAAQAVSTRILSKSRRERETTQFGKRTVPLFARTPGLGSVPIKWFPC